jgi:serine/threonine-protein kinase HipA
MGVGDAFTFDDVLAFQWADFARQCGINKTLLAREMSRMAAATRKAASILPIDVFDEEEQALIFKVREFVFSQCDKLVLMASQLRDISDDLV